MDPFERLENKLDRISDRLARIEGAIERHDERTVNHHERIVLLEQGQRKATWALAGAGFAVVIALIPIIVLAV
jgi:hypothetical protein